MKKTLALVAAAAIWLGAVSAAQAADESIELSLAAKPSAGPLFKEVHRPVDASLTVTVSNPPSETKITPLKVATVTFPADMEFFPDEEKTPACSDEKLNERTDLSAGVAAIVRLCPDSVIGTGTSVVQIGQNKGPEPIPTVTDPKLAIFNAGRNEAGRPKILIYGFSPTVNSGLLMKGTLALNGELRVEIGVMPFDSSVSRFTLGIPGEQIEVKDDESASGTMLVKGLDPTYLRGKCSTGTWRATGKFVLGTREDPSGVPISESTFVDSNAFDLPCKGLAGKAKLKIGKIKGPRRVAPGRKAKFVIDVSNQGTATARRVRLSVTGLGKGAGKVGSIGLGKSRKITVKVKARNRKGAGKLRFRLTVNGSVYKQSVRKIRVG